MIVTLILLGSVVTSVLLSEAGRARDRLQSRFGRVLLIHAIVGVVAGASLSLYYDISGMALFLFYLGSFLSWFGVRSHLESSILLRILSLLRIRMSEAELLKAYESHYGMQQRFEELERGGFVYRDRDMIALTKKGNVLISVLGIFQ